MTAISGQVLRGGVQVSQAFGGQTFRKLGAKQMATDSFQARVRAKKRPRKIRGHTVWSFVLGNRLFENGGRPYFNGSGFVHLDRPAHRHSSCLRSLHRVRSAVPHLGSRLRSVRHYRHPFLSPLSPAFRVTRQTAPERVRQRRLRGSRPAAWRQASRPQAHAPEAPRHPSRVPYCSLPPGRDPWRA